jgi:uncharacterized protein (TIGR03435 family)
MFVGIKRDAGRISMSNMPLRAMIHSAYALGPTQIVAPGPDWTDQETYDLIGTFPAGRQPGDVLLMIQELLRERCRLVIRRETADQPVYTFVIAKSGVKMKPHDPAQPGSNRRSRGHFEAHGMTIAGLGGGLRAELGRFVLDGTGLSGTFDFILDWAPAVNGIDDPSASGPSLMTAVQEQLGLSLESRKAPIETLIIDHIERPTEN